MIYESMAEMQRGVRLSRPQIFKCVIVYVGVGTCVCVCVASVDSGGIWECVPVVIRQIMNTITNGRDSAGHMVPEQEREREQGMERERENTFWSNEITECSGNSFSLLLERNS